MNMRTDPVVIGERKCLRDDGRSPSWTSDSTACRNVREPTRVPLGTYRGLTFGVVVHGMMPLEVYVEGKGTRQTALSREHQGPRAVLNAVERLIEGYGPEANRIGQDLAIAESQLRDYQARLGAPFMHEAYFTELTQLRDQLKAGLSGKTPEPGSESPNVSELANWIKAIKGAHTIVATPQRREKRVADAEEPVTVRIRRRAAENVTPDAAVESDTTESPDTPTLPESEDEEFSIDREPTYQDRVARSLPET